MDVYKKVGIGAKELVEYGRVHGGEEKYKF